MKVTSGIRKSETELKRERMRRYRAKKKEQNQSDSSSVPIPKELEKGISEKQKPIRQSVLKEKALARFVAIDGEGKNNPRLNKTYIDSDGKRQVAEHQDYVLLRSNTNFPRFYDSKGLSTVDCFSWLCNLSLKEYGATFVIFGGGYDVTMWMRDIPYKDQQYLREYMSYGDVDKYEYEEDDTGKKSKKRKKFPPVYFAQVYDVPNTQFVAFEYEYMPRKWFKLTRYECEITEEGKWKYRKDSRGHRIKHGSITVYDVWGFFQSTFVNALADYGLLTEESDYHFLASMKSKRDQFETMDIERIDDYCKKECEYLVKLMDKLQGYFRHEAINVTLSRWDGAGAAASALLKQKNIKDHIKALPSDVMEAALHAYSGGRIELIQYGHTHSSKEYTEKQARSYCKKVYGNADLFREKFIACTYLKRIKTQKLVNKTKAVMSIERLLACKGIVKPYNKVKYEEYQKKYVAIYLDHYYTFDHIGYILPCIYDYDINSAYPTTTTILPSLKGGEWLPEKEIKSSFAMVHIKWNLSGQRFYPFFFRTKNHMIVYPTKGESWVWLPEYEAYLKHADKFVGTVEVVEVWNFYPETDEKPFSFIPDMAKQRLEWKELAKQTDGREGGQHVAIKLILNSLYGKLAQQVGGELLEDGTWKLPPYLNMAYAGYITASTRASLFDSAMQSPDSVVMFATDGIFTTQELDLPLSNKLGEWEVSRFSRFTAVQAGVYYRETQDWQSLSKSRGFEKGSIREKDVLERWEKGYQPNDKGEYVCEVIGTSRHFITFGRIAVGEKEATIKKNMKRLCCWERKERKLALEPNGTKRMDNPKYDHWKRYERLVPTLPLIDYNGEYNTFSTMYRSPYYIVVEQASTEELEYIKEQEEKQTDENIC
jgi:hypothetical protein